MPISANSRSKLRPTASKRRARRIRSPRSPTWSPSPIRRERSWKCSSATPSHTRNSRAKGIVPYKLGHVAFHVTDVKHVTKFYCDVLGFRESDWMARLLLVPALRSRPSHHQSDGDRLEPPLPHRLRAARLGPHARRLRLPQPQRLQAPVGSGPARHRPQSVRLSSRAQRPDHRDFCRARPHERGARLFRAAALAPRQSAAAEGVGEGSLGLQSRGASCRATK